MFYVAYPAAVTTGKVLLQTAPPGIETFDGEMARLKRVMEEVSRAHLDSFSASPNDL